MRAVKSMFIQDLWLHFVHLTFKHGLSWAKTWVQYKHILAIPRENLSSGFLTEKDSN